MDHRVVILLLLFWRSMEKGQHIFSRERSSTGSNDCFVVVVVVVVVGIFIL
jgi:hypothetical protein